MRKREREKQEGAMESNMDRGEKVGKLEGEIAERVYLERTDGNEKK